MAALCVPALLASLQTLMSVGTLRLRVRLTCEFGIGSCMEVDSLVLLRGSLIFCALRTFDVGLPNLYLRGFLFENRDRHLY